MSVSILLSHITSSLESLEMQGAVRGITVELEPSALKRTLTMYGMDKSQPGLTIRCGPVNVNVMARAAEDVAKEAVPSDASTRDVGMLGEPGR